MMVWSVSARLQVRPGGWVYAANGPLMATTARLAAICELLAKLGGRSNHDFSDTD